MKDFVDQYSEKITGVVSCFDRILFKGYLPLGFGTAMERFISNQGLLLKDFKRFVTTHSETIKAHAEAMANKRGRPFLYLDRNNVRKEDEARRIAQRDGITRGLVCVFRAVEGCQSFKLVPGEGRPRLRNAQRKCLCYYFYYIDRGVRVAACSHPVVVPPWWCRSVSMATNTWRASLIKTALPMKNQTTRFYGSTMWRGRNGLPIVLRRKNWPRILSALARRVNPLLKDLLSEMDYYWVVDQAEFATDVMFQSPHALKVLYENLLRHTVLCFSPEDILTFLGLPAEHSPAQAGRKLHGNFQGEVLTDFKNKRHPGARVKHRMCENWIKMYDKQGVRTTRRDSDQPSKAVQGPPLGHTARTTDDGLVSHGQRGGQPLPLSGNLIDGQPTLSSGAVRRTEHREEPSQPHRTGPTTQAQGAYLIGASTLPIPTTSPSSPPS